MTEIKHGEVQRSRKSIWFNARKCDLHDWHGHLYVCKSYSKSLRKKIQKMGYKFAHACRTGAIKIKVRDAINQI